MYGNMQQIENHSVCGVGMLVNMCHPDQENVADHLLVEDALKVLANFEYRSGINLSTDECDGAGIRFFGLPTDFFNRLIQEGHFDIVDVSEYSILTDRHYAIGHYFLPSDILFSTSIKHQIEDLAKKNELKIYGWRDLGTTTNDDLLSENAIKKKPGIWQAIILSSLPEFDTQLQSLFIDIYQQLPEVHILSQSRESMVFKGMIKPSVFKNYFQDFLAEDFKAHGAIIHGRFATNTNPQWKNAQPCNHFIAHNGEFNSASANLVEMKHELEYRGIVGLIPETGMSDSLQFDYDLFNQLLIHRVSLIEGLVRLMPPLNAKHYHTNLQMMLTFFGRERTAYNGPAFVVGGLNGYFFAKLDSCGLRPSRWNRIELENGMQRICATSDDYWLDNPSQKVIHKSELSPGGMLLITPNGEILNTEDILYQILGHYSQDYFISLINNHSKSLGTSPNLSWPVFDAEHLNRKLFACAWDFETITKSLSMMAENGQEPLGAMGDDTNPLHSEHLSVHLSYFFHQLFAQVSAPSIDSIREKERFNLNTSLKMGSSYIPLQSPILRPQIYQKLQDAEGVAIKKIHTYFLLNGQAPQEAFQKGIYSLMQETRHALEQGYQIFEITDEAINQEQILIPDLIALAAVKKVLSENKQGFKSSIIVNSLQITGPHQAACLVAVGANAIFSRGAFLKITELYDDFPSKFENYCKALEKSLLKTMGKVGITDVNNYINGQFIAALGLDLESESNEISLASLFSKLYSPLKGIKLQHIANALLHRHQIAYDEQLQFNLLPNAGHYMPEKSGMVHGYSPVVVNAFTSWIKEENLKASLYQLHKILEKKYHKPYLKNLEEFSLAQGFLDPSKKNNGFYPAQDLEQFQTSSAFLKLSQTLNDFKHEQPTCLRDFFKIKLDHSNAMVLQEPQQSQEDIRRCFFSGSMSQGALTVAEPDTPHRLGAHETLTRGMNAIGAMSSSGEGGENYNDLRTPLFSTKSKQIASGRFGISARQIIEAQEMEIKISQGAKPGEGGELPGSKVSIRFAAQRGGLPGSIFISPPPHHDIYSIEDLEQLIRDIKTVNPRVKVAVKLVASKGIGTIAVGVAKAGADVINIASHSGGTAAAQQSSIKHTGLPGEIGLVEADRALRQASLRHIVKLRTSGGIKTASDIIVAAILGADQFELGTTSMITLGCKMQRTCNQSCQPGVATDGHLFKGDQITTERFFVNLASEVQSYLVRLGISHLDKLRRQTNLLELIDTPLVQLYDFNFLLRNEDEPTFPSLEIIQARRAQRFENLKEQLLIQTIQDFFSTFPDGAFVSDAIELNAMDLSFGAGIAGAFIKHLELHLEASIQLNTFGIAGQSFGFVMPKGMSIYHQGIVQDGCGKSMTGGYISIKTLAFHTHYQAHQQTIGGNALFYGASGGKIFINGRVGHRFGILMKGAQVVVEGLGDLGFEYMTSGTALILGHSGHGLGTGANGGVIISYIKEHQPHIHEAMQVLAFEEAKLYEKAIKQMLKEHIANTDSELAKNILNNFSIEHFQVSIAKELNKISDLHQINPVIKTYEIRQAPLTSGMQVWLEQTIFNALTQENLALDQLSEFKHLIQNNSSLFTSRAYAKINQILIQKIKNTRPNIEHVPNDHQELIKMSPKVTQRIEKRLSSLAGELDELLMNVSSHLNVYISTLKDEAEGCSGCRAQSCAGGEKVDTGCPSGKSINSINATLKKLGKIEWAHLNQKQWRYLREAFELQIKESPFIAYTGAACPAPCQDACTESIPSYQPSQIRRGKAIGEPVHIKHIEFLLYQLGRGLGWFDGKKVWSEDELNHLFGSKEMKNDYDIVMAQFKPPFQATERKVSSEYKKLVIIGSGPSGMQMAFEALKDGVDVHMYEKSDRPGGLLVDGIPAHKFDKIYLQEDFEYLQNMGMKLFLNSEVTYSEYERSFKLGDQIIVSENERNTFVALCIGSGLPRDLPKYLTENLSINAKNKIIQATHFLKAVNDVADILRNHPQLSHDEKQKIIQDYLSDLDPRGKKIVVLGGGDTAQDVIRWVARYFNHSDSVSNLEVLVRGPEYEHRGLMDAYPCPSRAPTIENRLKHEEVLYIQARVSHLVETTFICEQGNKLAVGISESSYLHHELIENDKELKQIFDELPREKRTLDLENSENYQIDHVDMIICALGFQGRTSFEMTHNLESSGYQKVFYAGDASDVSQQIIVGAQANAKNTYHGQIRKLFFPISEISKHSLFNQPHAIVENLNLARFSI